MCLEGVFPSAGSVGRCLERVKTDSWDSVVGMQVKLIWCPRVVTQDAEKRSNRLSCVIDRK